MTETTSPQDAFTVTAQTIHVTVSDQPDIDNEFGPGSIRPDSVRLSYRGQRIDARVDGQWVREGGELTTERLDQYYAVRGATDIVQWPDWLCALATLLRPAAPAPVSSAPADRAALRDRIAALFRCPPEAERLGDATPGEITDAVLAEIPETTRLHDEILTLRADLAKLRDLLRTENKRANDAITRETTTEEAEEEQRLALSQALGLGTGAPWAAIRERATELQARLTDYENRITWGTTCGSCAHVLDSSIRETERAEQAEAAVERVRSVLESEAVAGRSALDYRGLITTALLAAPAPGPGRVAGETQQPARKACTCSHPADEHSIYGCADDCGCEWMPKRLPPMDPVHILGIYADELPAAVSQPETEA